MFNLRPSQSTSTLERNTSTHIFFRGALFFLPYTCMGAFLKKKNMHSLVDNFEMFRFGVK